jgi:putative glutamine amidotransferase
MIRIGLTSTRPYAEDGVTLHADVAPYVAALERAGAKAVLFDNAEILLDSYVRDVQGIVLAGGVDVDVARYGGTPKPSVQAPNVRRDAFELAVARAARERSLPLLGICRGLQLANVAFGGTLVEHIPDDFPQSPLDHQQLDEHGVERSDYAPGHLVAAEPGSKLANFVGTQPFFTNSMHHQAVRAVAADFRVAARAPDGVVEALDARFEHPFYVLVQWHPEELRDAASDALFGGLIAAAQRAAAFPW